MYTGNGSYIFVRSMFDAFRFQSVFYFFKTMKTYLPICMRALTLHFCKINV